jgi:DNA polymerase-4
MDAFFASVEQRDDPSLIGKPVIVGGHSKRGVVAAASYEARRFGVFSAMPMVEALRRCPQAVVVGSGRGRYEEVSAQIFAIFRRYTPLVEGLSVDEAFLDVTGSQGLFGDGEAIARRIKEEIQKEIRLTASAGVAPSKFIAKIASDLDKPDGLVVVREEEVREFLRPLPIKKMWGVGPAAQQRLSVAGYETFADLADEADPRRLRGLLGSWGPAIAELARGIDPRPVVPSREAKSIGAEETFESDLIERRAIEKRLLKQSQRVARRLFDEGLCAGTVTVKIKYKDFTLKTRQLRLPGPVDDAASIYEAARRLLDRFALVGRGVRLTGVSVSDLSKGPPPRTLFPDEQKARRRGVQKAMSELNARFGGRALTRAALLEDDEPSP